MFGSKTEPVSFVNDRPSPVIILKSAMKHSSRPASPQNSPAPSPFTPRAPLPTSGSSPPKVNFPQTPLIASSSSSPFIGAIPLANSPESSPTSLPVPFITTSGSASTSAASSVLSSPLPGLGLGLTTPQSTLTPSPLQSVMSPPLTPGYTPKVSFDTFENQSASMFSFTLQVKSDGYRRARSTRVFLCATSPDESGREALDWCLEALIQDGDELIVFRGVDEDVLDKDHNIVREEARELMRSIQSKSVECDPDRKLSLIVEYIPGRVTDTIDRLIALYRPDSLIVGTRGKRNRMSMTMSMSLGMGGSGGGIGSVSKYCLSHSPVPVIVVRPERKVRKVLEKRRADPKRGRHFENS